MNKDRAEQATDVLSELRDEVSRLRAKVEIYEDAQRRQEERDQAARERNAWAALPTEEKNALELQRRFPTRPGDAIFYVSLPYQPRLPIPAQSRYEAIGRYNEFCGIQRSDHTHIIEIEGQETTQEPTENTDHDMGIREPSLASL